MTDQAPPMNHWSKNLPHVRKALQFIARKGAVTSEQLVEWDHGHGRRLFLWDDAKAGSEFRLHQAILFLNRFRAKFEGMRVRAFIHLRENVEAGIDQNAYYTVETISQNPGMREQVIQDITKRMASLASELKMWNLNEAERAALFERLEQAME
jgi:hypothetical protein